MGDYNDWSRAIDLFVGVDLLIPMLKTKCMQIDKGLKTRRSDGISARTLSRGTLDSNLCRVTLSTRIPTTMPPAAFLFVSGLNTLGVSNSMSFASCACFPSRPQAVRELSLPLFRVGRSSASVAALPQLGLSRSLFSPRLLFARCQRLSWSCLSTNLTHVAMSAGHIIPKDHPTCPLHPPLHPIQLPRRRNLRPRPLPPHRQTHRMSPTPITPHISESLNVLHNRPP